ncbi:hypothetical protein Rhe02_52560 [Rhizocola hellebori]|uniref:NB-ARC domain-containing protein n=1 Tax=Rhizocola hellebori TaxID=1392758 RepID=A0A8J3QC33_9ACTN|nr:tetratricopeptide repeat protein [Rhizocola hellebori]GIH07189.1 hypothetical protein Rhe02_52560 [Rhizocola hellebori]
MPDDDYVAYLARVREAREPELRAFCDRLRQLHLEAGGPTLDALAKRGGLPSKSRISEILRAKTKTVPSWTFVQAFVMECKRYARERGRLLSVSVDLEFWRREHGFLGDVLERARRTDQVLAAGGDENGPLRVVPRSLLPDVLGFVGRAGELAALSQALAKAQQGSSALTISVLSGMAGVGKTALAVHWAHSVCGHFPDGQLYVDLRGYDRDQPMSVDDALGGLLRALRIEERNVPLDPAERSAYLRTALAGRRTLLVLDNAHSPEQVRPLLPGTPTCLVVVTSRDSLAGLVARDGAQRIDLDVLPLPDAVDLLRSLLGARVDADPAAATAFVELCVRLPLAIRVGAELAIAQPQVSLADLWRDLAVDRRRLDLLTAGGDERTAVRAVFSWSYRHLPAGPARAFRLLGISPCVDGDFYAVAHLAGMSLDQSQHAVAALARAHLVQFTVADRFTMHDLLRVYGAERVAEEDVETDTRAALEGLFDYYLSAAAAAMDVLYPHERHQRPHIPHARAPFRLPFESAQAKTWLDNERANLVAITIHAASHGWPAHACHLAAVLRRYLDTGAHYIDGLAIHSHALQAAIDRGDRYTEALTLHNLGRIHSRVGHRSRAIAYYQQALPIRQQIGDRAGESDTLNNLGNVYRHQRKHDQALEHYQQALAIVAELGDASREGIALHNIGIILRELESYDEALSHLERALTITQSIGNRLIEGNILQSTGVVYSLTGHTIKALDHYHRALTIARQVDDRVGMIDAMRSIGNAHSRLESHDTAIAYLEQALAIATQIANAAAECDTLNELGMAYQRQERFDEALRYHQLALRNATDINDTHQRVRAHLGIAAALEAGGRDAEARTHRQAAAAADATYNPPEVE